MKKYIVLLALCLCQYVFATGASRTTLKITPLSINEQGALLYRYKIITNPIGAGIREDVLYGIGSFKDGQFISLQEQVIYGDIDYEKFTGYEKYEADVSKLNEWLMSPCKSSDLKDGFTSCNLENYRVNRLMSVEELRQAYGVDITKDVGYFLLPGKLQADEKSSVYVTYARNGFIIVETGDCDYAWIPPLDGVSALISRGYSEKDYQYYECANVTGIIVKE